MRLLPALICLAVVGCGSSEPKATTGPIPRDQIGAAPETARTPEGARGADKSHFLNGPIPPTLFGGNIHIDALGLRLIENFEEIYRPVYCPYWDAYGRVWTRGYGETDWSGNFGGVCISHAKAEANLHYLVEAQYQYAVRNLGVSFNHHQVDALDSFVWNLGAGIFTGSLRYSIQHHNPYPMLAYDIAGGQVLSGLAHRRRVEVALFLSPDHEAPPETNAQKRARLKRSLAAAVGTRTVLRAQIVHYRVLIDRHRCRLDRKGHSHATPHTHHQWAVCRGWVGNGNSAHARGDAVNARIRQLERELA